jgi:uncharacterized protein
MRDRRFGKTNLDLSIFSLGTMRCLESETIATQTIQQAVALGINHLETAQGYGKSEVYLGAALRTGVGRPRSQLHITTKIPPTATADAMERAIDQSLERLGLDYVDMLALHGVNTAQHLDWVRTEPGCMAAVERAIADGRVRHVGFSTHGSLEIILAAIATQRFAFVNLHYTYFFQRNALAVEQACQQDMGVFIISPADKGGLLYTPPARLVDLCQPFSPLELNYRFLLSDRRVTTLSVGPANPAELAGIAGVSDRDGPLEPEETAAIARLDTRQIEALEKISEQDAADDSGVSIQSDRCSQCYACLPCPEGIQIPEILRLRNLAVAYDMTEFGQYRYRMFGNAGHWFPGVTGDRCTDCGDCLPRCPENLDIPTLLRDTHGRLQGRSRRRLWG